jgi:hypothetical protein
MGNPYFSLFDMAICGVPALGIGIWQLVSVNREIGRDKQAPLDSPETSGHPVREHRLDDR